ASNAGAVYVFVRSNDSWVQEAYLKASNPGRDDNFGCAVAVSGGIIVVGAFGEDSANAGVNGTPDESAAGSGAAYVFVRNNGVWTEQAYLKASNPGASDSFGSSVAVSGETVVVGAWGEDGGSTTVNGPPNDSAGDRGAAYVFTRTGFVWTQQAYLKALNTGAREFGRSVGISGDAIIVGSPGESSSTSGINSTPNNSGATDSGAAYVFRRNGSNWNQEAFFKASNPDTSDLFGRAVAISGDLVVVGAYNESSSTTGVNSVPNNNSSGTGAAYVFVKSGEIWSQDAYLKASNPDLQDRFGWSVAVANDLVVVGAYDEGNNEGAAYVFEKDAGLWSQRALLKGGNTDHSDHFGAAVAVTDDLVVAGAPYEDGNGTGANSTPNDSVIDSGAAYVFGRSEGGWSQDSYLKASNTSAGAGAEDEFGYAVAISGNTAVVGAPLNDSGTDDYDITRNMGAAFVFVKEGGEWVEQAILRGAGIDSTHSFGWSVGISGDSIVVGAPGYNSSPAGRHGAAFVFVRNGDVWSQQAMLMASSPVHEDEFGSAVAISGDTVVVGAHGRDQGIPASGAAYVFTREASSWSQQAFLRASNPGNGDGFGYSVAIAGDALVVGAPYEDSGTMGVDSNPNETASASGAAYVFERSGASWTQGAYLKASNTGSGDNFGWSVAVSGNTVAVGAPLEATSSPGVNGASNENATAAGAAYVFHRVGGAWSQEAFIKASNAGSSDHFGWSTALSEGLLVVGAYGEDSSATGINGAQDNAGIDSGAAYVFSRSGATWSQQAFLKASNTNVSEPGLPDSFGWAVAVHGESVVVGARWEDSSTVGVN
ncbi:MAG: hypothetical protein KDN05_16335, partial [Verrucomicrobiae bacterium]|nr:hypothetical protein [Verrucomicrobiae bacterium]